MKILLDYTLDCMKRNKRSSISIMVAILMASTMLSTLCSYLFNLYSDNLNYILEETGYWHGELFGNTMGNHLETIEQFEEIEATMIKGNWKVAKIEDPRRDYLIWRDANAEYFNSMPEGGSGILEGRVPTSPEEIVLSKQYFEHHPELKIGDTITLPLGIRLSSDGNPIEAVDKKQEGEYFSQTGTISLIVVGKQDVTTSSIVPAYTALGYLDNENILQEDELTIYFRFKNIYDTYKILPEIAKSIGYEPDEFGEYNLRYNTDYLLRKGVLPPNQINILSLLLANQMPIMFGLMGLLIVGVFVLIIHNAFNMSAQERLKQLGIFASVGATPKQIKCSVILEGLILSVIPLPIGTLLGHFSVAWMMNYIKNAAPAYDTHKVVFVLGWQSILPAILLTFLTVWWSATIPARKISKLSPLKGIKQGEAEIFKKTKKRNLWKIFGLSGELAGNALFARKKSYKTATWSLVLSFLTLCTFLCINTASSASKAIYQEDEKKWENQDIRLYLKNIQATNDLNVIIGKVGKLKAIQSNRWYNEQYAATWLSEDAFSKEFQTAGGFQAAGRILSSAQLPFQRDEKYRVLVDLVGMEEDSFLEYCNTLGIDHTVFYNGDTQKGILYNTIEDVTTSTKRNKIEIPYLNVTAGDVLRVTEKTREDDKGNFLFPVEISAIAAELPNLGNSPFGARYDIKLFVPMSRLNELTKSFANSRTNKVYGVLCTKESSQITATHTEIEEICDSYFGSGDYSIFDEKEYFKKNLEGQKTVAIIFLFISGLLAIIGLSNTWFVVQGTLSARRLEFAMFRSIGLSPKRMKKMLCFEAVLFGATPILISLPFVIILQSIFLKINEITLLEWLPFAPWFPILFYIIAVLAVTISAYTIGYKKLQKENIMEAIKLDNF